MNRQQARSSAAFLEHLANPVARRLGRDHGHVNILGRIDGAKADIEAVGKHQHLARRQIRQDRFFIERGLPGVGREDHDHVRPLRGFRGRHHLQPFGLGLGPRAAALRQAHAHLHTAVAQIQRVRMPLRSIPDDGHFLGPDQSNISILVFIQFRHEIPFLDWLGAAGATSD